MLFILLKLADVLLLGPKKEDMQGIQQFIFARLMILIRKPFLL